MRVNFNVILSEVKNLNYTKNGFRDFSLRSLRFAQ